MLKLCTYGLLCSVLVLGIFGCKKFTKDIADVEEPSDAPEYTVEYNQNISPAEGGSRKPTN